MDFIKLCIDYFLHFETHLDFLITNYNTLTYFVLFMIIFVETGLIVMPFLPGDSLLFAIGAFAARGVISLPLIIFLLITAAFLGDALNYSIGKFLGPKIFDRDDQFWLNKKHLSKAKSFYEKYGAKTIIIARFIPIVRTFAPFVAGIGVMSYRKFLIYNFVGGCVWVISFTTLGHLFGNLDFVQKNFKIVILAIIFLSVLPAVIEFWRERSKAA